MLDEQARVDMIVVHFLLDEELVQARLVDESMAVAEPFDVA